MYALPPRRDFEGNKRMPGETRGGGANDAPSEERGTRSREWVAPPRQPASVSPTPVVEGGRVSGSWDDAGTGPSKSQARRPRVGCLVACKRGERHERSTYSLVRSLTMYQLDSRGWGLPALRRQLGRRRSPGCPGRETTRSTSIPGRRSPAQLSGTDRRRPSSPTRRRPFEVRRPSRRDRQPGRMLTVTLRDRRSPCRRGENPRVAAGLQRPAARCRLTTQTKLRLVELRRCLKVGDRNHRSHAQILNTHFVPFYRAPTLPKPTPPTLRWPTSGRGDVLVHEGRAWLGRRETDLAANGRRVPSEPSRWYKCACLAR